jgi:hypothetical protein
MLILVATRSLHIIYQSDTVTVTFEQIYYDFSSRIHHNERPRYATVLSNYYTILKNRYRSFAHVLALEKYGLKEYMVVLACHSSNRHLRPLAENPNAQWYCAPQCLLELQLQIQAPLLCLAASPCLLGFC